MQIAKCKLQICDPLFGGEHRGTHNDLGGWHSNVERNSFRSAAATDAAGGQRDSAYQEAIAWARDFAPEADKEWYSTALDHAHRNYALSVDHVDAMDQKADDLMKTAVALTALLVGALKALNIELTWWFSVAFVCFLAAIVLVVIARRPTLQATPGDVREVLGFVEDFRIHDRFQIEALLAASFHCAVVGTQPLILWKAQQLVRATALFVVGVLLLPLSF